MIAGGGLKTCVVQITGGCGAPDQGLGLWVESLGFGGLGLGFRFQFLGFEF